MKNPAKKCHRSLSPSRGCTLRSLEYASEGTINRLWGRHTWLGLRAKKHAERIGVETGREYLKKNPEWRRENYTKYNFRDKVSWVRQRLKVPPRKLLILEFPCCTHHNTTCHLLCNTLYLERRVLEVSEYHRTKCTSTELLNITNIKSVKLPYDFRNGFIPLENTLRRCLL